VKSLENSRISLALFFLSLNWKTAQSDSHVNCLNDKILSPRFNFFCSLIFFDYIAIKSLDKTKCCHKFYMRSFSQVTSTCDNKFLKVSTELLDDWQFRSDFEFAVEGCKNWGSYWVSLCNGKKLQRERFPKRINVIVRWKYKTLSSESPKYG